MSKVTQSDGERPPAAYDGSMAIAPQRRNAAQYNARVRTVLKDQHDSPQQFVEDVDPSAVIARQTFHDLSVVQGADREHKLRP